MDFCLQVGLELRSKRTVAQWLTTQAAATAFFNKNLKAAISAATSFLALQRISSNKQFLKRWQKIIFWKLNKIVFVYVWVSGLPISPWSNFIYKVFPMVSEFLFFLTTLKPPMFSHLLESFESEKQRKVLFKRIPSPVYELGSYGFRLFSSKMQRLWSHSHYCKMFFNVWLNIQACVIERWWIFLSIVCFCIL